MRTATTILALCVSALIALGSVILYSALMISSPMAFYRQMGYLGVGLAACLVLSQIDYRRWKGWIVWVPYLLGLGLLVMVFIPQFGVPNKEAKRWVVLAGLQIQPLEVARLAMILALAAYVDRYQRRMRTFKYGILGSGLIAGSVIALVALQPDLSSACALTCVAGAMIFLSGVRWPHVLLVGVSAVVALGVYATSAEYRMKRIRAYLDPEHYAETVGRQNDLAEKALAFGGGRGVGLADSPFKRGSNRVPLHFSDFIFSVVGAEGGLIATMGTLLLFLTLLVCGTYVAWHARDMFGFLLASGITSAICLQAFVHMGVVSGLLPNTGFPLPFISHGGTNLVVTLASVGLLFSVARKGLVKRDSKNPFERHIEVPVAKQHA